MSETVMSLDEVRCESVTVEKLRADIIRSAARGQGPTFIAAKLDVLISLVHQRKFEPSPICECPGYAAVKGPYSSGI